MKDLKLVPALVFVLALLTGCAAIEPALKPGMAPEPEAAYVSGKFTRSNSGGFAFVLVNQSTGTEYRMSLGEDTMFPKNVRNQVVTVKVPPGRYAVTQWFTYSTLTKERSGMHAVMNPGLSTPFMLTSGSVVFLGNYAAETEIKGTLIHWTIKPRIASEDQARYDFGEAYPLLAKLNFVCLVCRRY